MKYLKHILLLCLAAVTATFASCGDEEEVQEQYAIKAEITRAVGLNAKQNAQLESYVEQISQKFPKKSSEDVGIAYFDNTLKQLVPTLQEALDNFYKSNGADAEVTIKMLNSAGKVIKSVTVKPDKSGVVAGNGPYRIETLITNEGTLSAEHLKSLQDYCKQNTLDINENKTQDQAIDEYEKLIPTAKMLIQGLLDTWKKADNEEGEVQTRLLDASNQVLKSETYSTMSTK